MTQNADMLSSNIHDRRFCWLGDLFEDVLQTISDWNLRVEYFTYSKYRDELIAVLRKKLNHSGSAAFSSAIWVLYHSGYHFIKKKAGRSLADIGIDDEIGIELA